MRATNNAQPCRICIAPRCITFHSSRRWAANWRDAVSPREPVSGRSHLPAAKAACALPDGCVGQASAGESDEFRPAEIRQSPAAKSSSGPAIVDSICNALAAAATENDLPIDFFTRLDLAGEPLRPDGSKPRRRARRGAVHAGDREAARACRPLRPARSNRPIREAPARPAARVRKSRARGSRLQCWTRAGARLACWPARAAA